MPKLTRSPALRWKAIRIPLATILAVLAASFTAPTIPELLQEDKLPKWGAWALITGVVLATLSLAVLIPPKVWGQLGHVISRRKVDQRTDRLETVDQRTDRLETVEQRTDQLETVDQRTDQTKTEPLGAAAYPLRPPHPAQAQRRKVRVSDDYRDLKLRGQTVTIHSISQRGAFLSSDFGDVTSYWVEREDGHFSVCDADALTPVEE